MSKREDKPTTTDSQSTPAAPDDVQLEAAVEDADMAGARALPIEVNTSPGAAATQGAAASVDGAAAAAAVTVAGAAVASPIDGIAPQELELEGDGPGDRNNNSRLRHRAQFMEHLPISFTASCKNTPGSAAKRSGAEAAAAATADAMPTTSSSASTLSEPGIASFFDYQAASRPLSAASLAEQPSTSAAAAAAAASEAGSAGSSIVTDDNENSFYHSVSFHSEELLISLATGDLLEGEEFNELLDRQEAGAAAAGSQQPRSQRDEFGTQRVYKKTSPNCVLTLYLPSREITLTGNNSSMLRGIVFVDPKAIEGYRIYAQLTLTFRYGREDEEVMGLRFCNEAIMSLHQIWPRVEDPTADSLSPLQEALMRRLGEGAHPFALSLSAQAPPSVQLVPAKRYYGAPIGTSYDVRCFIADKTDEKFHRRASVKMGVRVIYRTDVFQQQMAPEQFATLDGNVQTHGQTPTCGCGRPGEELPSCSSGSGSGKNKSKSERGDSFAKLRLSPKAFRFSGRFGRSKSEVEKYSTEPFHYYSKSFQEQCESGGTSMIPPCCGGGVSGGIGSISVGPCGGPQGTVDKPFLLHDGRVGLRASLNKGWYTHGEDVNVKINIRNDSRKTVRKLRVCAIQHVDVCMFNNGKFKNVVADSDTISPAIERTVQPGAIMNANVALRPQRGPTKNWIALEDTLQRSTEPDEITGAIAASAVRPPNFGFHSHNQCGSPAVAIPHAPGHVYNSGNAAGGANPNGGHHEERNVFAIYVSYYVKVKLTLSGMGGELSLKLPFALVHVDESQRPSSTMVNELRMDKLSLNDVPANRKHNKKSAKGESSPGATTTNTTTTTSTLIGGELVEEPSTSAAAAAAANSVVATGGTRFTLERIDSVADEPNARLSMSQTGPGGRPHQQQQQQLLKRRLQRSETLARDLDEGEEQMELEEISVASQSEPSSQQQQSPADTQTAVATRSAAKSAKATQTGAVPKSSNV